MKKIILLIKKEYKLFTANKVMLTFYLGGPILYGLLFGAIYTSGKLTHLPVIVIDKDHSPMSATFIDMLEENEAVTIKYISYENVDIQNKFLTDEILGAVIIPEYFEADILQRKYPEINTYINNSNLLASGYVTRSINLVAGSLNAVTSAKTGKVGEAFHVNTFRLFNPASNYLMFIWPSYLAIILQSVVLVVIAMSFATETENRSFHEMASLQLPVIVIMCGKLFFYWMLSLLVLLFYGFFFYLFRQGLPSHLLPVLFISGLFIAAVSFQGMIAGLLIKSQLKAVQFLIILSMPAYVASGFSWPFSQDGLLAQIYGLLFPFMPFVNGFRILLIEHGRLNDIKDFLGIQVAQLTGYLFIAWLLLKFKISREMQHGSRAGINFHES